MVEWKELQARFAKRRTTDSAWTFGLLMITMIAMYVLQDKRSDTIRIEVSCKHVAQLIVFVCVCVLAKLVLSTR